MLYKALCVKFIDRHTSALYVISYATQSLSEKDEKNEKKNYNIKEELTAFYYKQYNNL